MIDTNTNKIIWVAMAVGVVAILGLGTMTIFPDALSKTQTQITKINKSFNDKTKDISNDNGSNTNDTSDNKASDTPNKNTNDSTTESDSSTSSDADKNTTTPIVDNTPKENTNDSTTGSDSSTSSDADKNTTTPVVDNTPKETTTQVGIYTVTTDSTGYDSYTVDNSKAGFKYTISSYSNQTITINEGGVIGNTLTIPDYLIINGAKYKVTAINTGSYFLYSGHDIVINHIAKTVTSIGTDAFTLALVKGQTIYVNRATGDINYLTYWGSYGYDSGTGMNAPFKMDNVTIKYYD